MSRFPVVVLQLSANPTVADYRKMFDACNALAAERKRFAQLVDMRKANPFAMSATMRQETSRMYLEGLDVRRAVVICEARVIEHPLIRCVAVAFDWIVGHHWPTATFATMELAEAWIETKIRTDKAR